MEFSTTLHMTCFKQLNFTSSEQFSSLSPLFLSPLNAKMSVRDTCFVIKTPVRVSVLTEEISYVQPSELDCVLELFNFDFNVQFRKILAKLAHLYKLYPT